MQAVIAVATIDNIIINIADNRIIAGIVRISQVRKIIITDQCDAHATHDKTPSMTLN
jgi:hypothetical protein